MSGIAGIIDFDGATIEPARITSMTSAMTHRGPDGIRHWRRGAVALGHCLLRTTTESREERQPLACEDDSLVLVMDGRLDNWQELREELTRRGAILRDRSDAELVLRAYQAWGRECLAHLDGDFALAVWDRARRAVFCARDRMGRKPFNYHWDGKRLTFASELHTVLAMPWVTRTLNEGTLSEYLAGQWISRDETPWTGVRRLVPAHWMEIGQAGRTTCEYWQPDLHAPIVYGRDDDYVEHYRHLLADAIRRQSRTHGPLACEVSGGLDSSAVFAVAVDLQRRRQLPAPGIAGFTLRFDGDVDADELIYARAVAAHVGAPVHEIDPARMPLSWYEAWARSYGEFPGYPNGVMGLGIRQAARERGARALLVGGGGDEWTTGTRAYYIEELSSGGWRHLYRALSADVRDGGVVSASRWLGRACARLALPQPVLDAVRARRGCRRAAADRQQGWLSPALADAFRKRAASARSPAAGVRLARAGQAALLETLYSPYDLLAHESEERLAASEGIELRLPLATPALVQFAFSTPERLRLRGQTIKVLHRQAMTGLLPATVLERTSKADFMVTFRDHADELRDRLTADVRHRFEDWVQRRALDSALDRFGASSGDGAAEWRLWSLFGWSLLRPDTDTRSPAGRTMERGHDDDTETRAGS